MASKMSLPWYRMYSEARIDAKLRALTDAERRVWFHLRCFAAEQDSEGRGSIVGYDDDLLAVELCDGDTALLRQTIDRLKKLRILAEDENGITFCAFEKPQYDKPSNWPERIRARVAAFRERQRQDGNVDVTRSNADVTPRIAIEKEKQREKFSPMGKVHLERERWLLRLSLRLRLRLARSLSRLHPLR